MQKQFTWICAVLGLALGLTLGGLWLLGAREPVRATAASFIVTRFDDPVPDGCQPGDCSLREAIIAANGSLEPNSITLAAGTYVLTLAGADAAAALGDLDIAGTLTLVGAGAEQTFIDADSINERVFELRPGAEVTLQGVSVINGAMSTENGGGISCNQASLTLENVILRNNVAQPGLEGGGLYAHECTVVLSATQVLSNAAHAGAGIRANASVLTMINSTIAHNATIEGAGGGIMALGTATSLRYSTLFSNTARTGGGGYFSGAGTTLSVANCLLAENTASVEAGGLAIFDNAAWARIENTTVSGNRTDGYGGGINTRVPTTITHSTITENWAGAVGNGGGGGLFAYQSAAQVRIQHTILAGNVDRNNATNPDCMYWSGAWVTSQGYNLVQVAGSCAFSAAGDLTGLPPLLGPLADNGGATLTHALLLNSPARDAGHPAFVAPPHYDQRGPGFSRVVGGRVDIGAFEAWQQIFLPLVLRQYGP